MTTNIFKLTFISLFLTLSVAGAATPAIGRKHQVDLQNFAGKTYLQALMEETSGIKANLDEDWVSFYEVADWKTVEQQLENFDAKISKKVLGSFDGGKEGFKILVDSLEGQSFQPSLMLDLLKGKLKTGGDIFAVAQFLAMASGAGTLVVLNEENYFYNYGYKSGADPEEDVKSGRSFGAGPTHNANDASDVFYLNELESYLKETPDLKPFYEAILKILIRSDASGLSELSPLGQSVATDFIAIYTAESDRHLMVNLNPNRHPWEIDLAGTTFVSAFGSTVGKIMKDGTLQAGKAREWWAMSKINIGRSGIGETRADRRKLQRLISGYLKQINPESVAAVEEIIGSRKDKDIFQGLLEFLNQTGTQAQVKKNGKQLIQVFSEMLAQTQSDAESLEKHVLDNQASE